MPVYPLGIALQHGSQGRRNARILTLANSSEQFPHWHQCCGYEVPGVAQVPRLLVFT
jgi:hypothetical protein